MIIEKQKIYSTGDEYLDELLERAFCEGYELGQKEFGRTGLTKEQAEQFFTKTNNRKTRKNLELTLGLLDLGNRPPSSINSAANTKRDVIGILDRAKRIGKGKYTNELGGSGFSIASDHLINIREKLFKPLSKKKRQELNKTIMTPVLKSPSARNALSGRYDGLYKYGTQEYK